MSFHYLYALQQAASVYSFLGDKPRFNEFSEKSELLQTRLKKQAFDCSRKLFVDEVSGKYVSQHTNIFAILTNTYKDIVDGEELLTSVLQQEAVAKTTTYFSFYLFEAMFHVGRADLIWPALKPWHDMLDNGLTTFSETPEPTRSDCHAWSSHPLYHFFASVLGVRPLLPGCDKMSITPINLREGSGKMPKFIGGSFMTPHGKCTVNLKAVKNEWQITGDFPVSVKVEGLFSNVLNRV